jgi:hypothetical protein
MAMRPYAMRDGAMPRQCRTGRIAMRPYRRNHQDAMHVIGHYHPRVQLDFLSNRRGPEPFFLHDFAIIVPAHLPIGDIAKQELLIVRTNGNEVGPW